MDGPGVDILLGIDQEYREKARAGVLQRIAPRRMNPDAEAWLPVLHTRFGPWHFSALFSNTELAHESAAASPSAPGTIAPRRRSRAPHRIRIADRPSKENPMKITAFVLAGALLAPAYPALAQPQDRDIYGYHLMTPDERSQYRERMRAAQSAEEREQIRAEHYAQMRQRAEERGITLPDTPAARGGGMMGPGGGMMGPGGGMMGPGRGMGGGR